MSQPSPEEVVAAGAAVVAVAFVAVGGFAIAERRLVRRPSHRHERPAARLRQ
jgi:hypothetical protein